MVQIDRLRLEFISPRRLTKQRRFELSNKEACQIMKDIQLEYADYIVNEIKDFTKADCIKVTHFCPDKPNEEILICFELDIENDLLMFIRTHRMPVEVKPG